jgi:dTDP-4-amino-4,6-dideoxygalactose transaminase
VDVLADTFDMEPASLLAAVRSAREQGLSPRAVIAVDLFGQPADYDQIEDIAEREGLDLLCDAAQSFGAEVGGRKVGVIGAMTTTSFYPAKPLGAFGDGGAIFTDNQALAEVLRSARAHGQGAHRYEHVRVGVNSRLDTIQAAILLEKLKVFSDELRLRQGVAERYEAGLADLFETPIVRKGATSTWAQYTIRVSRREELAAACARAGVPTAIHYPIPLPLQVGYRMFPSAPGGVPVAEQLAQTVLSLPMHPYLDEGAQAYIIDVVRGAASGRKRLAG